MQNQPVTKSTLAQDYGVEYKVFYSWLVKMGFYTQFPEAKYAKILNPKQVNFIFSVLEPPEKPENTTDKP